MSSNNTRVINANPYFGSPKLETPAVIALVGYIVMAIVVLLPFEYPVYDERRNEMVIIKYNFGHRLLTVFLMTIPIILSIYTINCIVSGQCLVWSYIISISTVLWIALFILSAILYTWKPVKNKNVDE